MKLVVDGIIYSLQTCGGISRMFNEILPRLCELASSLEILLLTDKRLNQALPQHPRIYRRIIPHLEHHLYPRKLWEQAAPLFYTYVHQVYAGRGKNQIWHSTLYTEPKWWAGDRVVTVFDMTHERFPHLFNKPWDEALRIRKRKCLLSADAIICISETTATDLEHFCHVSMERIWVIPLAFSAAFHVLPDLQHTHFEPFLLYVGDRSHYKNFTRLLEAYAVWSQFKEVALVVVGRGWTQQEQLLLEKLGITQRVRLLTNVADKKLCQLYNQATAFVYPSLYEGFGIPLLEAMACGCPIVASRISSTIEVAENIPIYFDATETAELVAALKQAFIEGRDSQRTKAGLKHVQQYSWDKTANDTLGVYRSLT